VDMVGVLEFRKDDSAAVHNLRHEMEQHYLVEVDSFVVMLAEGDKLLALHNISTCILIVNSFHTLRIWCIISLRFLLGWGCLWWVASTISLWLSTVLIAWLRLCHGCIQHIVIISR
jgi:hypothetical protein